MMPNQSELKNMSGQDQLQNLAAVAAFEAAAKTATSEEVISEGVVSESVAPAAAIKPTTSSADVLTPFVVSIAPPQSGITIDVTVKTAPAAIESREKITKVLMGMHKMAVQSVAAFSQLQEMYAQVNLAGALQEEVNSTSASLKQLLTDLEKNLNRMSRLYLGMQTSSKTSVSQPAPKVLPVQPIPRRVSPEQTTSSSSPLSGMSVEASLPKNNQLQAQLAQLQQQQQMYQQQMQQRQIQAEQQKQLQQLQQLQILEQQALRAQQSQLSQAIPPVQPPRHVLQPSPQPLPPQQMLAQFQMLQQQQLNLLNNMCQQSDQSNNNDGSGHKPPRFHPYKKS